MISSGMNSTEDNCSCSFDSKSEGTYNKDGKAVRMANQIGKRYICTKCGSEFVVTRGGEGSLKCCGQPVELKK